MLARILLAAALVSGTLAGLQSWRLERALGRAERAEAAAAQVAAQLERERLAAARTAAALIAAAEERAEAEAQIADLIERGAGDALADPELLRFLGGVRR